MTCLKPMGEPWYRHGLRFRCLLCGLCCTGREGYVWVTEADIGRIAEYRKETPDAFRRGHTRWAKGKLSLLEKPGGDCEMFDQSAGCTIYAVRPPQCRTWPFWPIHVATPAAWRDVGARCPGVGAGDRIPADLIEALVRQSADITGLNDDSP
jgi:Fe-S-cluster containining protein